MALSDLAVYSEYTYTAMTEVLAQQVALFNAATRGGIVLRAARNVGDYSDEVFWQEIAGLVRRRNAYGSGAVNAVTLEHLVDTMVKVASGTPPVKFEPQQFTWIQRNPEEAGAVMGQQLAKAALADMLHTALRATVAALAGQATNYDTTGQAAVPDLTTFIKAAAKLGDSMHDIVCWVMHSKSVADMYKDAAANAEGLFAFDNIFVKQDGFGRTFVMTDAPPLYIAGTVTPTVADKYRILGLTPGAVAVEQNGDFFQNVETKNGEENIARTIQSEWTYNVGVKGFTWDKTSGGHSPNDSALGTTANWDKTATSHKNLAGVLALTL